ncbi:LacI family transcriptional regulator [Neobacillus notoginsengisoli]|uniref:LacI family transcriptional regulator n=1 Tax=Neobacillus notoginsengisoli TaxID=1578198 RepID=A0A417YXY3_9BACI|nr:LacI family DNA-binding transcriptional regulator [Neobacillus notoginsengisoli]RHW42642.1 LacI family transcriptional regulator [Neobacillus notoginsengisoli]
MNYTIYDIARLANVSKSTVSRVLNNQSNISETARARVLKAIEELNYQPSKLARGLSAGFDAIMVLSRAAKTTADNPFFSEALHLVSQRAEDENFDVILQTSKNSRDELEKCIKKINEKMVKGILMLSSPANEQFFKELDQYNVPIVVIGKVEGDYQNIFSVDTDNYQDSYDLCKLLIDKGHTDIACLHSPIYYHVSVDRLSGFQNCLRDHNIMPATKRIIDGGYTIESAYSALKQIFDGGQKPTALFATDDLKVLGAYKFAAEHGIEIPGEISLVGYSNSSFTTFLSPQLTRIEIPFKRLGEEAMNLLFTKIKGCEFKSKRVLIPTEKIFASSVKELT